LDLITRRDSNARVISIDINCRKHYRGSARNYGPAIIPMSKKTLELSQTNETLDKTYRVSFVGALYDYRKTEIANLERKNIHVEVNPHRITDEEASYQTYLGALGRSIFTINFSRANKMNRQQLKCRMLESALYGAIAVSDESKWTKTFFRPNVDYIYVRKIGSAHKELTRLTSEEISTMKENALQRALEINVSIV
jgi:spore maturation protein CgeB